MCSWMYHVSGWDFGRLKTYYKTSKEKFFARFFYAGPDRKIALPMISISWAGYF